MDTFWEGHWWLLVILASFTIPLAGIAMGAWSSWLYFRNRRAAMETLREYAAQGREPAETGCWSDCAATAQAESGQRDATGHPSGRNGHRRQCRLPRTRVP